MTKEEGSDFFNKTIALDAPPTLASVQNSITLLIVLNTVVLAMDHHPMDDDFATYLEIFNFAFSVCFMLEMVLKVGWCANPHRCFRFILVCLLGHAVVDWRAPLIFP